MADKRRLLDTFAELVSIDSPSFGEKRAGRYVKDRLVSLGLSVFEDGAAAAIGSGCGNLYAFLAGNEAVEPLLFCVHLDTVEPACGKRAVFCEDGVIRSGGDTVLGADDFAGVAAVLEALTTICESRLPHGPIELLFTVAEEAYCCGSRFFDFSRVRAKEAYVLDLSGPVGTAARRAPTILQFTVTVTGRASHAGFAPEEGISAIAAAAAAIAELKTGRGGDGTTLNIGKIEGGTALNIVPDKCTVMGEIRSLSDDAAQRRAKETQAVFALAAETIGAVARMEVRCVSKAYAVPREHRVIRRFGEVCDELGLNCSITDTFGGSDNNTIMENGGITGLVIASAMNMCHSCREFTTEDELMKIAAVTTALMVARHG